MRVALLYPTEQVVPCWPICPLYPGVPAVAANPGKPAIQGPRGIHGGDCRRQLSRRWRWHSRSAVDKLIRMSETALSEAQRGRGRPRLYDRQTALADAMMTFHEKGFTATSMDDLAAAMGMNRPSLYRAFGNKQSIYRHAFENFRQLMHAEMEAVFTDEANLETALTNFYRSALDVYYREQPARGCFIFCTAPAEALSYDQIAKDMLAVLAEIDDALEAKFLTAQRANQWPKRFDARNAARIAQGILHSLALRARAGEPRASLEEMITNAVQLICATDN